VKSVTKFSTSLFHSQVWVWLVLAIILAVGLTGQLSSPTLGQAAALKSPGQVISLEGRFNILWADGAPGTDQSRTVFGLSNPGQADVSINFSTPLPLEYGDLMRMRGRPVEVRGNWENAPATIFNASEIVAENSREPLGPMVAGAQPWVTVMCKFQDESAEPQTPAFFQNMYSSSYPLLDHYWREQSYNQMSITGSQSVTHWFTLPQPRAYYIPGGVADLTKLANDCTAAATAEVNYPAFVGINMMFNDDLDGYAWGGGHYMTLDGITRLWYMTWEPPWGYHDLTVIAHEMGHGFGLPHSSFNRSKVYDNRWDVMSDTWTDCSNLRDVTYGCLGQQTIAYHKDLEGWLVGRQTAVPPGSQTTFTLEQLDQPATGSLLLAKVPINGTNRFYTVEVRRKVGYDFKLPGQAVILHLVDPNQSIPAQLVDLDGNSDTGDAGAQWLVGETFSDLASGIWIRIDQALPTGFEVTISNCYGTVTPPAPSATRTPTPTATPTRTGSPTFTSTPTRTPTNTFTPTRTNTPTRAATPTQTFTPFPTLDPSKIISRIFIPFMVH